MSPLELREAVLQELEPLGRFKHATALIERVKDGSKGEAIVVINACKCLHVIRNWCYGKCSHSTDQSQT